MNILDLSERRLKILSTLYYSNGYVTGQKIASLLDISSRTVRNEIKCINFEFDKEIIESNHKGYTLIDRNVYEDIRNYGYNNGKKRDDYILMKLLYNKKPMNLDEFSESLYFSKTTTLNELKKIVLPKGLKINKHNNSVIIEGDELSKRKLISQIIHRGLTRYFVSFNDICEYFNDKNGNEIFRILIETTENMGYHIPSAYKIIIMVDLEIALKRMKEGFGGKDDTVYEVDNKLTEIATVFCQKISPLCNLEFKEIDIKNIASILIGRIKPLKIVSIDQELKNKISIMIKDTFDFYGLDINFDNYLDLFTLHIQSLLTRCQNNNQVETIMNYNVRFKCPFIYEVSVHFTYLLKKEFDITLNLSEIGLNAILIGKALTRERSNDDIINAVLLSNNYQDTRDYIIDKINSDFKDQIKINKVITSYDELDQTEKFDLLITTVPQYLFNYDYARITYLYTIDDKIRLHNSISKVMEKKKNAKVRTSISNIFDKKLFFKNTKLNNMEEALNFLNDKLIKQNIVDENFIESVYKREELSSTVIDSVFAFPHSLNLDENKTKCIVLINEKGFNWGNHRIPFIFLFSINKKDRPFFEEMYNDLSKILLYNDNFYRIFDLNTYEDFISYIDEKLQYIF
jgi:lichenan operon transcriptional antiterminator